MTTKEYNQSVDLFADNVFRFILKNVKDSELAHDIVQETYLRLWKNVEDIEFDKAKAWLFSSAYRYMIDLLRRNKSKSNWDEIFSKETSHSEQYTDLNEVLEFALNRLPEIQRSVILLRDYEGYSYEEIGEITKLKDSQVKVYIFRARKALKDYLISVDTVI